MASALILKWAEQNSTFNTTAPDYVPSITVDTAQNAYIAYSTTGGVIPGGSATGQDDIVVFKLDSTGATQWAVQNASISTTGRDNNPSIAVDSVNNFVYVAYQTYGDVSGGGGSNLESPSIVLLQLNATDGSVIWARQNTVSASMGSDQNPSIAVDLCGNICLTYYTTGTYPGNNHLGSNDIVVVKVGNNGQIIWGRTVSFW